MGVPGLCDILSRHRSCRVAHEGAGFCGVDGAESLRLRSRLLVFQMLFDGRGWIGDCNPVSQLIIGAEARLERSIAWRGGYCWSIAGVLSTVPAFVRQRLFIGMEVSIYRRGAQGGCGATRAGVGAWDAEIKFLR